MNPDSQRTKAYKISAHQDSLAGRPGKDTGADTDLITSKNEWTVALAHARAVIEAELLGKKAPQFPFSKAPQFLSPGTAGVCIWVGGSLRGSHIVEGALLGNAVSESAAQTVQDPRFKPIAEADSKNMRVQVSQISSVWVRIDPRTGTLAHNKGYALVHGGKTGWFLPEVFSIRTFTSISQLARALAREKLHLPEEVAFGKDTELYTFEVYEVVESMCESELSVGGAQTYPVHLDGPIPREARTDRESSISRMVAYAVRCCNEDGSITCALSEGIADARYEWGRAFFSIAAMAEYARTAPSALTKAAHRAYHYHRSHLFGKRGAHLPDTALLYAYLGHAALSFGFVDDARMCSEYIKGVVERERFSPIPFGQAASFLSRMILVGLDIKAHAAAYCLATLARHFEEDTNKSTASYAELATASAIFYKATQSEWALGLARMTARWLMSEQLSDGAFRGSQSSTSAYTRGTGKVIEALAEYARSCPLSEDERARVVTAMGRGESWMMRMQYSAESSFALSKTFREKVQGGFRHDYFSKDAWLDAVWHFLLYKARRESNDEKRAHGHQTIEFLPLRNAPRFFKEHGEDSRLRTDKYAALGWAFMKKLGVGSAIEKLSTRELLDAWTILRRARITESEVAHTMRYMAFPDTPGFFACHPTLSYEPGSTDGRTKQRRYAHGFSESWERALAQSVGEMYERYFLSLYKSNELRLASVNELKADHVAHLDPAYLTRLSESQVKALGSRSWDESVPLRWVEGVRVSSGKKVLIPAQLVFWNYSCANDEARLCESNSSGLGAAGSSAGALLAGLHEVLERDAFLAHWLTKTPLERITLASVPGEKCARFVDRARKHGVRMSLFRAGTTGGIDAFYALLEDERGRGNPRVVLGGSCKSNPVAAIERALEEVWSIYFAVRAEEKGSYELLAEDYVPFKSPLAIGKRVSLWSHQDTAPEISFLLKVKEQDFSVPSRTGTRNAHEELLTTVEDIEKQGVGYEVFAYHAVHPLLAEAGIFATRVIVPALIPLYYSEHMAPTLLTHRLAQWSAQQGFGDKKCAISNVFPHPYP